MGKSTVLQSWAALFGSQASPKRTSKNTAERVKTKCFTWFLENVRIMGFALRKSGKSKKTSQTQIPKRKEDQVLDRF